MNDVIKDRPVFVIPDTPEECFALAAKLKEEVTLINFQLAESKRRHMDEGERTDWSWVNRATFARDMKMNQAKMVSRRMNELEAARARDFYKVFHDAALEMFDEADLRDVYALIDERHPGLTAGRRVA